MFLTSLNGKIWHGYESIAFPTKIELILVLSCQTQLNQYHMLIFDIGL